MRTVKRNAAAFVIVVLGTILIGMATRATPVEFPASIARAETQKAGAPKGTTSLRADQIRTRYLQNGTVTANKLAIADVTINVSAGAATATSAIVAAQAGGTIVGWYPSGNQDQLIDSIVLNANGSITITLAANATAINNFHVLVMKANAFGTT